MEFTLCEPGICMSGCVHSEDMTTCEGRYTKELLTVMTF